MHHSGPLLLTFEGLEQGFGGNNCQNGNRGRTLKGLSPVALIAAKTP